MYKSGNKKWGKKLTEEEGTLPKDDLLMLESKWLGDIWNSRSLSRNRKM